MSNSKIKKRIAVVADDSSRANLIEWSYFNKEILCEHEILANEITSDLLKGTLDMPITILPSGISDGYREFANEMQNKSVDIVIFFGSMAKDNIQQTGISDLHALATEQNIIAASNLATA